MLGLCFVGFLENTLEISISFSLLVKKQNLPFEFTSEHKI